MKVARVLAPVHTLGPGDRVCIWTRGCSKRCGGCISPELQPFSGRDTEESVIASKLTEAADLWNCNGLTVSGGDPFEQPECLLRLLRLARGRFGDILVYTGMTLEEIEDGKAGESGIGCLCLIDALIDGPYIESRNRPDCALRGSDNQKIHIFTPSLKETYEKYLKKERQTEEFIYGSERIAVGIPNKRGERK